MPSYVVFNGQTGEPVHTHFAPEGYEIETEDIFANVDPAIDRAILEIIVTEAIAEPRPFKVDLQTRRFVYPDDEEIHDSGGATSMGLQPELPTRPLQRVYDHSIDS